MSRARLTIDLGAIAANWRALDAMSGAETAAVVKADAYGLGVERVAPALAAAGARTFFVALAHEGCALRAALGPGPRIFVFSGLTPGDAEVMREADLVPLLNSPAQAASARDAGVRDVGLQLDSGMKRLGFGAEDFAAVDLAGLAPQLVMSHLACADEPAHPQNRAQRAAFVAMTDDRRLAGVARSLSATGGVFLGPEYHFDLTRPGIGLYGGLPFAAAAPVVRLEAPIIQTRLVSAGEAVGYGAVFQPESALRIATISIGYADGLMRCLGDGFTVRFEGASVRSVGRVSMDLITVDVTEAPGAVEGAFVEIIGASEGVDALARSAGTIGYEILTALGRRYERRYL